MKTLLLIIACASLVVAGGGCATCPKNCPPKDVVFTVIMPSGQIPVFMEKGHLNPDKEKETWIGAEEFKKQMEQFQPPEEESNSPTNQVKKQGGREHEL